MNAFLRALRDLIGSDDDDGRTLRRISVILAVAVAVALILLAARR